MTSSDAADRPRPPQRPVRGLRLLLRRCFADTLAKRLFGLMCVALVGSHLVAFVVVHTVHFSPDGLNSTSFGNLPTLSSLPPTPGVPDLRATSPSRPAGGERGPPGGGGPPNGPPHGPPAGRGPPADHGPPLDRGPPTDHAPPADRGPPPGPDADARGARPDGLVGIDASDGDGRRGAPQLPWRALLLDYGVRFAVMALAAWFGSRWLAAPVQRLVAASQSLSGSVAGGVPEVLLDERRGTREVREAARVFNAMARDLRQQFRSRGLMVAAISHDLRTPLTRLRMRLQNDNRMLEDVHARSVDDIREMSELIDNVLEVFRLDGAAAGDPVRSVDVDALVQSLVDNLAEQGQPVTYQGGNAIAQAQQAALRRVLDNLIGNALRYGERADVRLTVANGNLRLTVDDAGPGIAPAELEAVFEPFYRVEASRSRHTGGTGLGLYIARELTRRQGGTLTLANRAGGGLRAELTLPAVGRL